MSGLLFTNNKRIIANLCQGSKQPMLVHRSDILVSKTETKIIPMSKILMPITHFLLANVILTFTFAICYRPSVCRLSVTLVRPTQPVEIFGNFFHHTIAQGL